MAHTATGTFNVLYLGIESGPLASVGVPLIHGVEAAANAINASGGIRGHKIKLTIVDTQGNPATAVQLAQQYFTKGAKWNVAATDLNAISQALSPVFATQKVLAFGDVAATTQTVTSVPNEFFTGPPQTVIEGGVVQIAKKRGYRSVGLIAIDSASGHTNVATAEQDYSKLGIKTSVVYVPAGTVDSTPQLQQLMANKPQALELVGAGIAPLVIPARAKLGLNVPTICDDGCGGSADWSSFAPDQLHSVVVSTLPEYVFNNPATKTPAFKTFLKYINRLEHTHPTGIETPLSTYLMLFAAQAAANTCKCVSGPGMVKALATVKNSNALPDWVGPTNMYSSRDHSLGWSIKSYITVPAGAQHNGFWVKL